MGFWSNLFGEPKHFTPTQKYSNLPQDGQDALNLEKEVLPIDELFDRVAAMYSNKFNTVVSDKWRIKVSGDCSYIEFRPENGRLFEEITIWKASDLAGGYRTPSNMTAYAGKFKAGDTRSTLKWLESLVEKGEVGLMRTAYGKLHDIGITFEEDTLLISKDNKTAIEFGAHGDFSYKITRRKYDADLDLYYVERDKYNPSMMNICRDDYKEVREAKGEYLYNLLKETEDYTKTYIIHTGVFEQLETVWMEAFAATTLRDRILHERKLSAWMKENQRLHAQYNENAKKYSITPAGPLNSYDAVLRFLSLINRLNMLEGFNAHDINNYLIANNMASDAVMGGQPAYTSQKCCVKMSNEQIRERMDEMRGIAYPRLKWNMY